MKKYSFYINIHFSTLKTDYSALTYASFTLHDFTLPEFKTALNYHFSFLSRESIVSTASPILSPFLSKHGISSLTFFLLLPL